MVQLPHNGIAFMVTISQLELRFQDNIHIPDCARWEEVTRHAADEQLQVVLPSNNNNTVRVASRQRCRFDAPSVPVNAKVSGFDQLPLPANARQVKQVSGSGTRWDLLLKGPLLSGTGRMIPLRAWTGSASG